MTSDTWEQYTQHFCQVAWQFGFEQDWAKVYATLLLINAPLKPAQISTATEISSDLIPTLLADLASRRLIRLVRRETALSFQITDPEHHPHQFSQFLAKQRRHQRAKYLIERLKKDACNLEELNLEQRSSLDSDLCDMMADLNGHYRDLFEEEAERLTSLISMGVRLQSKRAVLT